MHFFHVLRRGRTCSIQQQSVPDRKCGGLAAGSGEHYEREFARDFTQSLNSVSRGNCHLVLCMQPAGRLSRCNIRI